MKHSTIKQIVWFLGITFSITYAFGLATYLMGGLEKFPLGIVSMPAPMLAAFFVQKVFMKQNIFKGGKLGIRLGIKKYWFIFPTLFTVALTIIYIITAVLFPSLLLNKYEFAQNMAKILDSNGLSFLESSQTFIQIFSILFINIVLGPFLNFWLFLGEEIGWRAFLTPKLIEVFGKSGLIIGGLIWALWHTPGILMGLNYPENPIFGNFLFIAVCISLGIIFQYFYLKSKSVFVVAITHGILNQFVNTVMMLFFDDSKINYILHGATGIIGITIFSVIAWLIYKKVDWED